MVIFVSLSAGLLPKELFTEDLCLTSSAPLEVLSVQLIVVLLAYRVVILVDLHLKLFLLLSRELCVCLNNSHNVRLKLLIYFKGYNFSYISLYNYYKIYHLNYKLPT